MSTHDLVAKGIGQQGSDSLAMTGLAAFAVQKADNGQRAATEIPAALNQLPQAESATLIDTGIKGEKRSGSDVDLKAGIRQLQELLGPQQAANVQDRPDTPTRKSYVGKAAKRVPTRHGATFLQAASKFERGALSLGKFDEVVALLSGGR